jgi:hypothetical protein
VRAAVRTVTIAIVAARRSNAVIGSPAAVLVAIGFIESADVPNANAIAIAVGGDGASLQQREHDDEDREAAGQDRLWRGA